jgi:hypothetical protein
MTSTSRFEDDCIRIWRFHEAPRELSEGMGHGGDEEMILLVPMRLKEQAEWWFDLTLKATRTNNRPYSNKLLCSRVRRTPDGYLVSTAHA